MALRKAPHPERSRGTHGRFPAIICASRILHRRERLLRDRRDSKRVAAIAMEPRNPRPLDERGFGIGEVAGGKALPPALLQGAVHRRRDQIDGRGRIS